MDIIPGKCVIRKVSTKVRVRRIFLCAVMMAFAGSLHATEDTVEVGPNLIQSILNQINTYSQRLQDYDEYVEQAMRWEQTYEQYMQQRIKIKGLSTGYDLPKSQELQEIPEDYLAEEKCGRSGGGFLPAIKLDLEGNYLEKQAQICWNIVTVKNRKFNSTVVYLNETAPKVMEMLKQSEERRQSSNEEGNIDASTNDAARINNELQAKSQMWTVQMQTYDAYIASMEESQKILVESAMKGGRNPLGTVLKTAALKAALSD